jgi:tRNA pseudouridine synthase 10
MTGEREDPTHATVEIHGAGGLYVKELVSGDEGRTEPNLADRLGVGAEVTALDVVGVYGEDEPFEDPAYFREAAPDPLDGAPDPANGSGDDADDADASAE